MAASMGKRRKPENSEGEQPEQRDRLSVPIRHENSVSDSVSTEQSSGGSLGEPPRRKHLRNFVQQQQSDHRPQGKRNLGIPQEPTRLHLRKLGAPAGKTVYCYRYFRHRLSIYWQRQAVISVYCL